MVTEPPPPPETPYVPCTAYPLSEAAIAETIPDRDEKADDRVAIPDCNVAPSQVATVAVTEHAMSFIPFTVLTVVATKATVPSASGKSTVRSAVRGATVLSVTADETVSSITSEPCAVELLIA